MTETTCRWTSSTTPRVLPGRHGDECPDDTCRGCLPCPDVHCRVCRRAHSFGTCAECMAETRSTLREIGRMCDALPEEVEARGIEGEAMMLLGPIADPEARGHLEASVAAGRVPADYLESADHELHPLFVLGGWEMVWRDALEQDDAERPTFAQVVDYLDRTMAIMGGHEFVPFEDFARDLRACAGRLESVLHDGEQVEKGAPCPECGKPLVMRWGKLAKDDRWVCQTRSCDVTDYTTTAYRGWVEDDARNSADRLTAADMALRFTDADYSLKASRVRVWGARGLVRKRGTSEQGLTLYDVQDVATRVDSERSTSECA